MKIVDQAVRWFVTEFYPQMRIMTAVHYEDMILERLHQENINLFSPWGPRYKWQTRGAVISEADSEVQTLRFLADMFKVMRQNMPGKSIKWIFLGADLYGTRINSLPEAVVAEYFSSLKVWLEDLIPAAELIIWSDLDDLAEPFREIARANLGNMIGTNVKIRADRTSKMMSGNADDYLVERLSEAMLIEELYHPIKISLAPKSKDAEVDYNLPRLYFLPGELRAPWL